MDGSSPKEEVTRNKPQHENLLNQRPNQPICEVEKNESCGMKNITFINMFSASKQVNLHRISISAGSTEGTKSSVPNSAW
jgi:hypothetical protein